MTLIAKEPGAALPAAAAPPGPASRLRPEAATRARWSGSCVALALVTALFLVAGLGDLLLFIAILIVIVMLHELGHFATAKWSGMKVTEYFVGFGPRLWSVRRGETEYGVKAIPAGGYVRITGFTVLEDVAAEDEPRAYRQQPFWKRIIVGSAGSAMHFLIAFVLALISVLRLRGGHQQRAGAGPRPLERRGPDAGPAGRASAGRRHRLGGRQVAGKSATTLHDVLTRSVGKPVTLGVRARRPAARTVVGDADATGGASTGRPRPSWRRPATSSRRASSASTRSRPCRR